MENILIVKLPCMFAGALLTGFYSFAALGQSSSLPYPTYQLERQSKEVPNSPHLIHWVRGRAFSLSFYRAAGNYNETNAAGKADFSDTDTHVTAVFDRQVNPSVGLGLSLAHVKSDSNYHGEDGGLTSDADRNLRSSVAAVDGTFKILDALIVGLKLGYQTSQISFNGAESGDRKFAIVAPALAWKTSSFELAAVQTKKIGKEDPEQNKNHTFIESAVILTTRLDSELNGMLWVQKNPLPVCCAFAHTERMVYGGKLFLPLSAWTVSPGYRYLSEFQEQQQPGSIEDVARHHVFVSGATNWQEWVPSLNLGYEWGASKTGPSSFKTGTKEKSEIAAETWTVSASWGRAW